MKGISTLLLCFLLGSSLFSEAQSDSSRYNAYVGTYVISTPGFPVNSLLVYWQDSVLAYKAGGAHGIFTHTEGDQFSFYNDDHEGVVTFKKNGQGKVSDIMIVMDGETYLGKKKKAGKKSNSDFLL